MSTNSEFQDSHVGPVFLSVSFSYFSTFLPEVIVPLSLKETLG